MSDDLTPKVLKIVRQTGIAGQYAYAATIDYGPDHGGVHEVTFIGNTYAERVCVVTPDFQTPVERSDLEGVRLSRDYVRRFFS